LATLANVRPAALPEKEGRAQANNSASERTVIKVGKPPICFSCTDEISAQELRDLQTNTESLKRMPTKRGPPKDRSLLPNVLHTKGKGRAPPKKTMPKKRNRHSRNSEGDSSSSSSSSSSNNSNGNSESCSSDYDSSDSSDSSSDCDYRCKRKRKKSSSKSGAHDGTVDMNCRGSSEYELLRLKNIFRDQEVLKALGSDVGRK